MIKRRNFLMFIVMFIFTFIGMNGVNAAKGLYCIYDDTAELFKVRSYTMLVQDISGNYTVYHKISDGVRDSVIAYDTFGWEIDSSSSFSSDDTSLGSLTECPKYFNYEDSVFSNSDEKQDSEDASGTFSDSKIKSNSFSYATLADESLYLVNSDNYTSENFNTQWLVEPESDGYSQSCLYSYKYVDSSVLSESLSSLQLDINFETKKVRVSSVVSYGFDFYYSNTLLTNYKFSILEELYKDGCPNEIFATYFVYKAPDYFMKVLNDYDSIYFSNINDVNLVALNGTPNIVTKVDEFYRYNLTNSSPEVSSSSITIKPNTITIENCEDIFGADLLKILHDGVNAIKIMIPLLLIGLGIVDFAKAVFGGSEDNMKKSAVKFCKRVLIGIVIFFIPSILNIILDIANKIWGNIDPSLCGIL